MTDEVNNISSLIGIEDFKKFVFNIKLRCKICLNGFIFLHCVTH